jgi:hypothetical protein
MSRGLDASLIAEYESNELTLHILVELEYDSGTSRYWSGIGDITYNSNTYTGTGALGSIGNVQENISLSPAKLELSLSGIPSSAISIALSEPYQGRSANVYLSTGQQSSAGVLDSTYVHTIFSGKMDVMQIREDGDTAEILLVLENELIRLERVNIRRWTDTDQKELYPNDYGFDRVQVLQDKKVGWVNPNWDEF